MIYISISFALTFIFSFYILFEELTIVQIQFYEIKRYLAYKKENRKKIIFYTFTSIVLIFFLLLFIILKKDYLYLFATVSLFALNFHKHKEKIIKLKITGRIKRIIFVYSLVFSLFGILFLLMSIKFSLCLFFIYETIFLTFFHYFIIMTFMMEKPLEVINNYKYKIKAIKKIKRIRPLLIGITGSYGKTSTKNYLYQLLSLKYRVCKTPKSYNTYLGILKSINEEMDENCEIMIIELGADRINGLDKILSILKLDISMITSIGPQHLKTFECIENIVKEKSKILDHTLDHIFLNYNYEYLRMLDKSKYVTITSYSYYKDSNIYIDDIIMNGDLSEFTLNFYNQKFKMSTNILGKHQLENLMGCIGAALYLGVEIKDITKKVLYLYNEKHRMEIKYINNIKIIDDSYNSNIKGFKCALDVLKMQKEYKVLITPGIIELGLRWDKYNKEIGKYASKCCDFIILVGKEVTRPLHLSLLDNGFSEENILILDNFKDAFEYVKELKKEIVVLIENDLPDFYLK